MDTHAIAVQGTVQLFEAIAGDRTNMPFTRLLPGAAALIAFSLASAAYPAGDPPERSGYYRYPSIQGDTVVFTSEGDLWTVGIRGGTARRLTSNPSLESMARISPDGKYYFAQNGVEQLCRFRIEGTKLIEDGTSERIAAARRSNPSPSLTADCELYLDACADPAFFRITADAPAVIGWDAILDNTQELIAISLAAAQADGE